MMAVPANWLMPKRFRWTGSATTSLFLLDTVNSRRSTNEQAIASNRWRGHSHVIFGQLVRVQDFELIAIQAPETVPNVIAR